LNLSGFDDLLDRTEVVNSLGLIIP
jgi:hypothetical protein